MVSVKWDSLDAFSMLPVWSLLGPDRGNQVLNLYKTRMQKGTNDDTDTLNSSCVPDLDEQPTDNKDAIKIREIPSNRSFQRPQHWTACITLSELVSYSPSTSSDYYRSCIMGTSCAQASTCEDHVRIVLASMPGSGSVGSRSPPAKKFI